MDVSKLTPAPWHTGGTTFRPSGPKKNVWTAPEPGMQSGQMVAENATPTDAEFIAMARNAFDGDIEALAWWNANRVKRLPNAWEEDQQHYFDSL